MKKLVLIVVMMVGMMMGGCGSDSLTALAGVTGMTATARILEDLGDTTDREKVLLLANHQAFVEELAAAETNAQRAIVQAKIEKNEKLSGIIDGLNTTVRLGEQAAKTDWKDPEAVGGTLAALIAAGIIFVQRRSSRKKDGRLDVKTAEINKLRNGNTATLPTT